jgi:hypothetical protein
MCYASVMWDKDAEARAEIRRQQGTWGGVTDSHEELKARDLEYWLAQPPLERLAACWTLQEELRMLIQDDEHPTRLQRSIGGVRQRGA